MSNQESQEDQVIKLAPSMIDLAGELKKALREIGDVFVPTPFPQWARFTEGGLRGFCVLGGGPKLGKSAMAQQIALMAGEYDTPVLYVDLEHSWVFLTLRMLCSLKGKTMTEVKYAINSGEDLRLPKFLNLLTFWEGKITPDHIHKNIQTLARPDQKCLLVIDSFQKLPSLCRGNPRESANLWLRELEAIKNQYPMVILAISELSRGEKGANYCQPSSAALKESGDLEYTAEQVYLLCPTDTEGMYTLLMDENRFGQSGQIPNAIYSRQDFKYWRWKELTP